MDMTIPSFESLKANLIKKLKQHHQDFGIETSIKLQQGQLHQQRCLITTSKSANPSFEHFMDYCEPLNLPTQAVTVLRDYWQNCSLVHFGLEANDDQLICKVYTEFSHNFRVRHNDKHNPQPSILLHKAIKWNFAQNDPWLETDYRLFATLSETLLRETVASAYPATNARLVALANDCLKLALSHIPIERLMLLQVTEQDNPRNSFDLNLYDANLIVADTSALLEHFFTAFALPASELTALLEAHGHKALGHLAGGVDRSNRPFFTIYFGVEAGT